MNVSMYRYNSISLSSITSIVTYVDKTDIDKIYNIDDNHLG